MSNTSWREIDTLFNISMVLSIIIFGNIAALSIHQIIKDNAVFMPAIHAVFLNPLFLAAGAYIGVYTVYRLILLSRKEWWAQKDDCRQQTIYRNGPITRILSSVAFYFIVVV